MSNEQVTSKCSDKSVKKQEVIRPTSILPTISPSLKHTKSLDSSKSSYSSSRISVATSKDSKKNTKLDSNDNHNLIIFGNSMLIKANSLPDNNVKTKHSKFISRTSSATEERISSSENKSDYQQVSKRKLRTSSGLCPINRRYSIETSTIRQAKHLQVVRKTGRKKCTDVESRSTECVFHENLSLDLSRMSDFADSEDEAAEYDQNIKQKTSKCQNQNLMRRRRSIDKDRFPSSKTSPRNLTSAPKSLTRRSSLQSVSSRGLSFTSYDNSEKIGNTYSVKDYEQYNSPNTLKNLNSIKNSESIYSSPSPDFTPDPSTCETSPCKVSLNGKKYSSMDSNRATISPTSQVQCLSSSSSCYTSWMERSAENELPGSKETDSGLNVHNSSLKERGEWDNFWRNYNSSLALFPKQFYDDCPTPFYEHANHNKNTSINNKIDSTIEEEVLNEGLPNPNKSQCIYLSRNEAKEMIHCAQRLAEILTTALESSDMQNKTDKNVAQDSKEVQVNIKNKSIKKNAKSDSIDKKDLQNCKNKNSCFGESNNPKSEVSEAQLEAVTRLLMNGITNISEDPKDVLL